jgi:hypothetical protein
MKICQSPVTCQHERTRYDRGLSAPPRHTLEPISLLGLPKGQYQPVIGPNAELTPPVERCVEILFKRTSACVLESQVSASCHIDSLVPRRRHVCMAGRCAFRRAPASEHS